MINFDILKMVLYDFDNTLCIHENHEGNEDLWRTHNINVLKYGKDAWDCRNTSSHMKEFMDLCTEKGMRQGLISATCPHHAIHKCAWVEDAYGVKLENFCVSNYKDKVRTMAEMAKAYDYRHSQMMIVDDYWEVLEIASNAGFKAYSPMQIVNYIEQRRKALHYGENI